MTWNEFKSKVDAELENLGFDGSIEIWYIDVNRPQQKYMDVSIDNDKELTITT